MASFDSASTSGSGGAPTIATLTATQSIVTSAGDSLMIVTFNANGQTPTGVTFNSVAATLVTSNGQCYVYKVKGPSIGTFNLIISFSGGNGTQIPISWALYKTASDVTQSTTNSVGSASSVTTSLTTTIDNSWTVLCGLNISGTGAWSAGTGSTLRVNDTNSSPSIPVMFDSNAAITPPASYSMTATPGSSSGASLVMLSVTFNALSKSNSDSIMNGASRSSTLGQLRAFSRAVSLTFFNASSRLMTMTRNKTFTPSLSFMNASSRLITFFSKGGIWTNIVKGVLSLVNQSKNAITTNVIVLTSGTSWTVPANWNSSNNSIEAVGAGGSGDLGTTAGISAGGNGGGGGGGGAYAKVSNVTLTPGNAISYVIGAGGAIGFSASTDTTFSNILVAKAGTNSSGGTTGGTGGVAASCTPSTGAFSGGSGGTGEGAPSASGGGGAGGGGAAGKNGAGATGAPGLNSAGGNGGQGDNAQGGTGGVGGSGVGGVGNNGSEWTTAGSGGGGGGGAGGTVALGSHSGIGGLYGAGGGGGGGGGATFRPGGNTTNGQPGVIVITYASGQWTNGTKDSTSFSNQHQS